MSAVCALAEQLTRRKLLKNPATLIKEELEQAGFNTVSGEDCRHEINKSILADCQELYEPSKDEQRITEKISADRNASGNNQASASPSIEMALETASQSTKRQK